MQSLLQKVTVYLFVICCLSALGWAAPSDPNIIIDPNVISIVAYDSGDNPAPTVLTLTNEGGSTSNWSIDTASKPDWIAIAPTSGALNPSQNESITLTYDISSLALGQYSYAFNVVDPVAENSPQTVTVSLNIAGIKNVPGDFQTIQSAIDAAVPGDTIIVAPGTYYENILFNANRVLLRSIDPDNSNVVASTVINGSGVDSVVTFSGDESADTVLQGFTLTNGNALQGGGIYGSGNGTSRTQATIAKCIIRNNAASFGGGIALCNGPITDCTISDNILSGNYARGGGLSECHGPITNCIVINNRLLYGSSTVGGGLAHCDGPITNCTITGNSVMGSWGPGGGLFACDNQIVNCIITGNTASTYGGGLYACDGQVINCTISGNTASRGGGLYECDAVVVNCIIWDNSGNGQIDSKIVPVYSCIQDWTGGGNVNISDDPMFVDTSSSDPTLWDLRLLTGSPCIDTGTNSPPGGLPKTDIEGFPRPFDGDLDGNPVADMGAHESFLWPDGAFLLVLPKFYLFSALQSGDNPVAQQMTIKNYGSQTLNWSADLNDKPDWLTVSATSGSLDPNDASKVTVSIDITGLSAGSYNYAFDVVDPAAENSPQAITVDLEVIGPIQEVSSDAFSFTGYEGGDNPDNQVLTIENAGGGSLDWSMDLADMPAWLTIAPTSGSLSQNETDDVTISIDTIGLSAGSYNYAFDVVDPAVQNSAQTITVDLEVIGPIQEVSYNTFSFTGYEEGDNPDDQVLTIENAGGGSLDWSVNLTDKPDWLTVAPTCGSLSQNETDDVTISIDITGLTAGPYSYAFEVVDPAAENSPQTVTVDLEVIGPILEVSSNQFLFSGKEGSGDPNDQTLTIENVGGGTMNWSIVDVDEVSLTLPAWLTITPTNGSLFQNETNNVTIAVDTTGLIEGLYNYSFDITAPDAVGSPQTAAVSLYIGGIFVPATYPTIQEAIDAADTGDTIIVSPGTYRENIKFNGKDLTLTSTDPTDPNIVASTIINGCRLDSVVIFSGTETADCELVGFTITNGTGHGGGYYTLGGGIYGNRTHASITNCIIINNNAVGGGGGLYSCHGIITGCTITKNKSGGYEGGLGGGLYGCGTIMNCVISDNVATEWCDTASEAYYGGSGGGLAHCATIVNCTITGNYAENYFVFIAKGGGGLAHCGAPKNCIIWDNDADGYDDQLRECGTPTYSCIQDWTGDGEGNINTDPMFVVGYSDSRDAVWVDGDYHLKSQFGRWQPVTDAYSYLDTNGTPDDPNDDYWVSVPATTTGQWVYDNVTSPCIDAGDLEEVWNDNGTPDNPEDDFLVPDPNGLWTNELWPHGKRINMGAYGGTPQASMSSNPVGNIADLDHDDAVDVNDLMRFSEDWLYERNLLDTDFNLDGFVNITDFTELAAQWLWTQRAVLWIPDPNINFITLENDPNPDSQSFTISNLGQQPLYWTIDDTGIADWLTIEKISGTLQPGQQDSVLLSVDSSALSAGLYHTEFEVTDPDAQNSPQTVAVDFEVIGPILEVSDITFSPTAYEGGSNPDPNMLTISNTGVGTMVWSIVNANEVTLTLPDWLSVTPTSGGLSYNETQDITLATDITGLPGGTYSYAFEISDPAADNSPQIITVNLEVIGPILDVSSNTLSFFAEEGGDSPDDQVLTIQNTGGGTLNWSTDVTDKPDWLTVSQVSGVLGHNETDDVTISVDTTGLSEGYYSSYVFQVVTDPSAQNNLQSITIDLAISPFRVPQDFPTIQSAINAAVDGVTVIVSQGTYYENINFKGKNIILTSTNPDDPTIVATTIIDGGQNDSVVIFSGSETSACVLSGFTITNGRDTYGGGVRGYWMNASIEHCMIIDNRASDPYGKGGGLYACNGLISNCTIAGNTAYYGGGLFYCNGPITNCTIADNTSEDFGGGLYRCDGPITNCTIIGNTAGDVGGGLYACDGPITNCTIIGNTSSDDGGGLYRCGAVSNCIIWANQAGSSGDQLYKGSTPLYSCIQNWTEGGTGNITSDPLFADAAGGDYHLQSQYGRWDPVSEKWVTDAVTSPCIDAGNPTSTEWQNEPTPNGSRINIGAYGGTAEASKSPDIGID